MVQKAKIFYFGVFILVVFAFIFHVTAMGHHHWKKASARNSTASTYISGNLTTIGLFTRCIPSDGSKSETCFPNLFPSNSSCTVNDCFSKSSDLSCSCGFLPSTKGIAACTIIASIFLGLAFIILFAHSINTTETRTVGLVLALFPWILLLLAFIFILITLILVGSYLSRDMMEIMKSAYSVKGMDVIEFREYTRLLFQVRVDWSTGLEIIALFFTFLSLVFYSAFVFKFGRS